MLKSTNLRRGRSCVFALHVHLVFVTKYRSRAFTKAILLDLREIFQSVCKDFGAVLVEFEGEKDHVHLLVNYPPKVSVTKLVNSLKGVSSRMIRKKIIPRLENVSGAVSSGHRAILPALVVVLPSPLLGGISNSKRPLASGMPYITALKGRVFRRCKIN